MIESLQGSPDPRERDYVRSIDTAHHLANIEKPYRDTALSLAERAISLSLPEDMRAIIDEKAEQIVANGLRASDVEEERLHREWLRERYADDIDDGMDLPDGVAATLRNSD